MDQVKQKVAWLRNEVAAAIEREKIDRKKAFKVVALVVSLYIGSVMMFFGMNFWLWSFTAGIKRSYASMFVPSIFWAAASLLTVALDCGYKWYAKGEWPDVLFWWTDRGRRLVFLIGLFDSLTGLAGMYAAVHVPQIMQSALISTGPLWTFLLAHVLYPSSQPPFHPILFGVLLCIVGGVFFALLPQILDKTPDKRYFSAPWALVYLLATAFFPFYNVLQGKFLFEFKDHCSPFSRKMIMLASETTLQLGLTILYFPFDSLPYFGKCESLSESFRELGKSFQCIGSCPNNALYMLIYVSGFWIRHIVFAYMNTYSPSVAAVTSMLTQPLNAFLMLAFPALNVYGSKKNWGFTFLCFIFLLAGMVLFICWHLMFKRERNEDAQDVTLIDTPLDELAGQTVFSSKTVSPASAEPTSLNTASSPAAISNAT